MSLEPLRRVGYSLIGLIAGNAALLLLFLLHVVERGESLVGNWSFGFMRQIEAFSVITMFSIAGWLIIGVPAVLALSSRVTARLPQFALLPIGALLGPLSLFSILFLGRGRITSETFSGMGTIPLYSAIVSGLAFEVHCLLLRRHARSIQ